MLKRNLIFLVILLSMFWATGAWAQMKDGLWEITTQMEIKGMPQGMPPSVVRQCIAKNDPVPKSDTKGYDCKTKNSRISGDTVTYAIECKGNEGTLATMGKTTYKGNTLEGTATTNMKGKGQPEMQMNSKISGKYIGVCPK